MRTSKHTEVIRRCAEEDERTWPALINYRVELDSERREREKERKKKWEKDDSVIACTSKQRQ